VSQLLLLRLGPPGGALCSGLFFGHFKVLLKLLQLILHSCVSIALLLIAIPGSRFVFVSKLVLGCLSLFVHCMVLDFAKSSHGLADSILNLPLFIMIFSFKN